MTLPNPPIMEPLNRVDLSDGPIAHYPFTGDADDQSGNLNNLENRVQSSPKIYSG